jgi:hypothetical protein
MKPITTDMIEKAWRKIEAFSDEQLEKAFLQFEEKQPGLIQYLEAVLSESLTPEETDELIFNSFTIYQIVSYYYPVPELKQETLLEIEERDYGQFKKEEDTAKMEADLDHFIDNHRQRDLLEEFMDISIEDMESDIIQEQSVSAMFFILAAVIGAIDESIK